MHLSAPRSTQLLLLGTLALTALGLALGGWTTWRLSGELQTLETSLTTTASFLQIERQIATQLTLQSRDWNKKRSEQIQAETNRLLELFAGND
ncbi:MAG: hypothetical protein VX252_15115, partial [Myxococcota bacterium]|nr:hypothetical protein [Myxococcota bacterium]